MYTQYFGLKENPFALSPDPRYLYLSQRHQDALAHLMYGITGGGGFVQLTGEVGTGKTMMIRAMLQRLPETVDVALVLYPFLSVREFMIALCDDLHIKRPAESTLKALIDTLNNFLLENHAQGRRTVLIVDEAHRLNREVLEQIRLLTNLETTKEKLLQIILVGQPELISLLAQQDMRQLAQRVTARYNLQALLPTETRAYVLHRCLVAGAQSRLFTSFALFWIPYLTHGVPRLINVLCDRALLAAYARGKTQANARLVRTAAREVKTVERPRRYRHWVTAVLATVLIGSGAAFGVWQWKPNLLTNFQSADSVRTPPDTVPTSVATASAIPVVSPAPGPVAVSSPSLAQLLADPKIPTDTDTAFTALFSLWSLDYAQFSGTLGCERAQQAGLRCLFDSGTWTNLRQLNRPAIIELVDGAGVRHHIPVVQLTDDKAVLHLGGQRQEFPFDEIGRLWFGKYLALWNPPDFGERVVRRGMRGASVEWVRDALARAGFTRISQPGSDIFDGELELRVKEFQNRHQIQDDGIVGKMTLVHLTNYSGDVAAPVLSPMVMTGTP